MQETPTIDTSCYDAEFPSLPEKGLYDLNPLKAVEWVPDVKHKVQESSDLDRTAGELSSDRAGVQSELEAVQEYLAEIVGQCIAKAETYGARAEQ